MHLCIDIGNTRCKYAIFDNGQIVKSNILSAFEQFYFKDLIEQNKIKNVMISSVKKIAFLPFKGILRPDVQLIELDDQTALPFNNLYMTPKTLGKDRLALVSGARKLYPEENLLVVDAGTCITYDFIDKDNNYHGGNILPGLNMRLKAMHHFTDKLPMLELNHPVDFLGRDTSSAMMTGVVDAANFELEGFRKAYEEQFGLLRLLVTGGDTEYFETKIKSRIFVHPDLMMIGLNEILEYNLNQS